MFIYEEQPERQGAWGTEGGGPDKTVFKKSARHQLGAAQASTHVSCPSPAGAVAMPAPTRSLSWYPLHWPPRHWPGTEEGRGRKAGPACEPRTGRWPEVTGKTLTRRTPNQAGFPQGGWTPTRPRRAFHGVGGEGVLFISCFQSCWTVYLIFHLTDWKHVALEATGGRHCCRDVRHLETWCSCSSKVPQKRWKDRSLQDRTQLCGCLLRCWGTWPKGSEAPLLSQSTGCHPL